MLRPAHASHAGMRKVETMHLEQREHLENWGLRIVRCCLLFLTTVGNTWDFPHLPVNPPSISAATPRQKLKPTQLNEPEKTTSRLHASLERNKKKTNERATMPKPCLCLCVCVWQSMRTCVWVCACLCMSVCCCTLGSCCRFEVGSPGAHSDNCTSIIFCSSILCWFFFPFTVLHYLNICLIAAYYFFLFSRFARELSKLKNMTKFGSGRSPRRQCEFIAGCAGIYPCNCSTHTVTMYV